MRPIRKIFDALENHTEGETLEFSSFYIVSTHSQSVASPAMGHVPPPRLPNVRANYPSIV